MSEPKRYYADYSLDADDQVVTHMAEDPKGGFVKWEDYARLKVEVERLEANTTKLCTHGDAEIARLKAEVERLTADLNKMTKTPDGVDYVEVDVSFWNKSGSRLPSSYSTFWSNAEELNS